MPLSKFFLSGTWNPTGSSPEFGIWALIIGTLKITVIATIVAVPIGLEQLSTLMNMHLIVHVESLNQY